MKVKVRYFTTLRELTGTKEEEIEMKDGSVLADLVEKVALKYGEIAFNTLYEKGTRVINLSIQFLVNGVSVRDLFGLEMELKDGDVVTIIYPVVGG